MRGGKPDYILFSITAIILVLGIFILASASAAISPEKPDKFLLHQIIFGLIPGSIFAFIVFKLPLPFLKKLIPGLLLANLVSMVLVFAPHIGISAGGANRWVVFGPFSFQPSEFLKVIFILYLAAWLSSRIRDYPGKLEIQKNTSQFLKNRSVRKFKPEQILNILDRTTLAPFLIIIGFAGSFLILQSDISTLGIIVFAAVIMYFLSSTPFWHSALLILLGTGTLVCLIKTAPYRLNRLLVFFQPGFEPMKIGYQIKQALITIGSGGILGLGLGMGIQDSVFLPHSVSDSIFAVFAKETGFIGSLVLLVLFLIFAWRGFNIAKTTSDKFSCLAACGISSWITIQAFVNISSMTGLLPLMGIPLPFISYGGSHLLAELIGVGILLNISKSV